MPTTATSRPAHSEATLLSSGISRRQGAHQVAQKLITRDFPLHLTIGVGRPSRSLNEKLGRRAGTLGCGHAGSVVSESDVAASLGSGALARPAGTSISPCSGTRFM